MDPTPFLQKENIELLTTGDVSINTVKQNHDNLINNGYSIDNETIQLVKTIGGISKILTHCLSDDNPYNMSQSELNEINHILTTNHNSRIRKQFSPVVSQLHIQDNYLYRTFGESKVIKFIRGKLYQIIGLCLSAFYL
eukprot:174579_1